MIVNTVPRQTEQCDLSIVVPSHNVVDWIDECIKSLVYENDLDCEILVVDDHSTDGTWERLTELAARDARIRVVRAQGSGGAQARNYGVELSRGTYVAFVDGDDIVPPGAHARMLASAKTNSAELVVGDFLKFSSVRTWSPTHKFPTFAEPMTGGSLRDRPGLVRQRPCWNRIFRRDFWDQNALHFPSVPRSNDIVPMIHALTVSTRINVVTDLVYLYRDRPGLVSMTAQAKNHDTVLSYLLQETICARFVNNTGHKPLLDSYWQMVMHSDTLVHMRRHIEALREAGIEHLDPRIIASLATLLDEIPPAQWDAVQSDSQVFYSALISDDINAAMVTYQSAMPTDQSRVDEVELAERVRSLAVAARTGRISGSHLYNYYRRNILQRRGIHPRTFAPGNEDMMKELLGAIADLGTPVDELTQQLIVITWALELHEYTATGVRVGADGVEVTVEIPEWMAADAVAADAWYVAPDSSRVPLNAVVDGRRAVLRAVPGHLDRVGHWRFAVGLRTPYGDISRTIVFNGPAAAPESSGRWRLVFETVTDDARELSFLKRASVTGRATAKVLSTIKRS